MTSWRFFLSGDSPELGEEGKAGLVRLPLGAPVSLAEIVERSGDWRPDDRMWREKYLGSDYEFTEIGAEHAVALLNRWVTIGRLDAMPSLEATMSQEMAEYLSAKDAQAKALWRDVPTPPGAEDLGR